MVDVVTHEMIRHFDHRTLMEIHEFLPKDCATVVLMVLLSHVIIDSCIGQPERSRIFSFLLDKKEKRDEKRKSKFAPAVAPHHDK